jgi:hypothetical protein
MNASDPPAASSRPAARERARIGGPSIEARWDAAVRFFERHARPLTVAAWAVLLLAVGVFLYRQTAGTTLYRDDWTWALNRRGTSLDTFLQPHYGHFSLIPVAAYHVLFAVAGLTDYRPYRALVILIHLTCALVVFLSARRRLGDLMGLLAGSLLLLFGPAAQNILWPFQIGFLSSLAAGGGALLALDRRTRAGNVLGAVLLAVSLACSGVGIPVALGVCVDVAARRGGWRNLWIVAAPLVLYGAWWLLYETNETGYWGIDVYLTPGWVFNAPAAVAASMLGLGGPTGIDGPFTAFAWGAALGVVLVVALIRRVVRLGGVTPRLAALLTMVLSFWAITALGRGFFAGPVGGRYLYVGGFFMLLIAAEAAAGVVIGRRTAAVLAGVVLFAGISNVGAFRSAASELRADARTTRVELGALDIGRPLVAADYISQGFLFDEVVAGPYFRAVDALGNPGASPAEIAGSPESLRAAADAQLTAIHRVRLVPAPGAQPAGNAPAPESPGAGSIRAQGPCLSYAPPAVIGPGGATGVQVGLPRDGLLVRAGAAPLTVGVRRFAGAFRRVGVVAAGASATLAIRPDLASTPWHVEVDSQRPLKLCARG